MPLLCAAGRGRAQPYAQPRPAPPCLCTAPRGAVLPLARAAAAWGMQRHLRSHCTRSKAAHRPQCWRPLRLRSSRHQSRTAAPQSAQGRRGQKRPRPRPAGPRFQVDEARAGGCVSALMRAGIQRPAHRPTKQPKKTAAHVSCACQLSCCEPLQCSWDPACAHLRLIWQRFSKQRLPPRLVTCHQPGHHALQPLPHGGALLRGGALRGPTTCHQGRCALLCKRP
jgi:hypothetical protein